MVEHGYGSTGWANPYFPGSFQIVQATILQTIQIGDDTTRAGGLVDLLFLYTDTVIGATTLDHDRAFSLYTQAGLVELTADGSFLFDGRTKTQTQINGVVDIHVTTAVTAVKGLNIDLVTHNLAGTEWAYGLYIDPNVAAATTGPPNSNMAAIYLAAPNDTPQCDTYGLYIEAGYDFGLAILAPVKLAQLTIAPTADGAAPWPLDFQLEGWPTAGVYTQGRVINMEYGLVRILDGALEGIHIDFSTNVTQNGQNPIGLNLIGGTIDESNNGYGLSTAYGTSNATGGAVVNEGYAWLHTVNLINTAGGSVTRQTNPMIGVNVNLQETAGAVAMTSGIFYAAINRTAGTPSLEGSQIALETNGAGVISGDFTGYYLGQAWDHDDAAGDTLRGIDIGWGGALPGAFASTLNLVNIRYAGQVGAAGALATLAGFCVDYAGIAHVASAVYGGRILVDSPPTDNNAMYGLQISKDITLPIGAGANIACTNNALLIEQDVASVNQAGFGVTANNTIIQINATDAMGSGAAPSQDTFMGTVLGMMITGTTTAATDRLRMSERAIDIAYVVAPAAAPAITSMEPTDIFRLAVTVPVNANFTNWAAGTVNFMLIDGTLVQPGAAIIANLDLNAMRINLIGSDLGGDAQVLSYTGMRVDMPANYTAAGGSGAGLGGPAPLPVYTNSAYYATGNGNNIGLLTGDIGIELCYSEAVAGGQTKAGFRVSSNSNIANAANAVFDGLSIDLTNIVYAGAAHAASGIKINMVAATDHAIYMLGAPAFITSADVATTLRTVRITNGAGPDLTIRAATALAAAGAAVAGGSVLLYTGDAAAGLPGGAAGGNYTVLLGNGAVNGAGPIGGAGGTYQITGGNAVVAGAAGAAGGGFALIGGNCDGVGVGAVGGSFQFTGGAGAGAGSRAGSYTITPGAPNAGIPSYCYIFNDANAGAIQIGSAAAGAGLSPVGIDSTGAMLLRSTLSTIELRTTGVNNITINPGNAGAARAFTDLNDTGIINGRWEATQIHDQDDFIGTVVDPKWTNTIVLNGTIAMLIGAASVEGGAVRLAVTGVNTDQATLSRGTNKFGNTARRMVYEVKLSPSNIAAASRTRISVKMWNNGAYAGVGSYLGFEFEPNAAANWFMCGANAGAAVRRDTGVAVGAAAYVTLRFEITAAGEAQAYINGVASGLTVPAANVPALLLEPYIEILNDAAGQAATLDVDYEKEWQTRP